MAQHFTVPAGRVVKNQALSITPMTGVVGPDSSVTIHVNFKPLEVQEMGRELSGVPF